MTEHHAQSRRCSCGATTKAAFPAEAKGPACYGPVVRAVAVYLMVGQHIPVARAAELLSQVCGAPVSTGWLAGLAAEAAGGSRPSSPSCGPAHGGRRPARRRDRLSGIGRPLLVPRRLHRHAHPARLPPEKRQRGLADMAVLPFFKGVFVTDGWKPYWSVDGIEHALCCAHLLRDLASLSGSVAHRDWADEMADLLVEVKDAVEQALSEGSSGLSPGQLKAYRSRYTKLVNRGFSAVPARHRAGSVHRDAYNLLCRFRDQRHEVQRYWADPAVSFDNNQAERDLRMAKLHEKISGCFRTLAGAKAFCAVRSYLQTARKHSLGGLDVLVQLFKGDPWLPPPGLPPP